MWSITNLKCFFIDLTLIVVFICLISLREKVTADKLIVLYSLPNSPDIMGVSVSFIMLLIKRLYWYTSKRHWIYSSKLPIAEHVSSHQSEKWGEEKGHQLFARHWTEPTSMRSHLLVNDAACTQQHLLHSLLDIWVYVTLVHLGNLEVWCYPPAWLEPSSILKSHVHPSPKHKF